jgi:hypothetical protein
MPPLTRSRWRHDVDRLTDPPPQRLCRFVASDWPSDDPIGAWRTACLEWLREVEGRRLPFGEHGDSVDVFRESRRITMEGLAGD